MPLGDVSRYVHTRTTQLHSESECLGIRKLLVRVVDVAGKVHRFLPRNQVPIMSCSTHPLTR